MKIIMDPFNDPALRNPYTREYGEILSSNGFSVRSADFKNLITPFDVLHLHWPESCSTNPSFFRGAWRLLHLLGMVLLAKIWRARIFYTAHNPWPHSVKHPFLLMIAMKIISSSVSKIHFLSNTSRDMVWHLNLLPRDVENVCIPHVLFRSYSRGGTANRERGGQAKSVFIFGGGGGAYIDLDAVESLAECNSAEITMVGYTGDHPNIFGLNSGIEHDELVSYLIESDIVCLPYTHVTNSGALFLALSLNKRILCPNSDYFREQKNLFPENILLSGSVKIAKTDLEKELSNNSNRLGGLSGRRRSEYMRKVKNEIFRMYQGYL